MPSFVRFCRYGNVLEVCCLDVVSHGFADELRRRFTFLRTVGRNLDACLYAVHIAFPYVVLRSCLVLEGVIRDDDVGKRCIVRVGWAALRYKSSGMPPARLDSSEFRR